MNYNAAMDVLDFFILPLVFRMLHSIYSLYAGVISASVATESLRQKA